MLKLIYFGRLLLADGGAISAAAVLLAIAAAVLGTQLSRCLLDAISDASFAAWSRRLIAAVAAGAWTGPHPSVLEQRVR